LNVSLEPELRNRRIITKWGVGITVLLMLAVLAALVMKHRHAKLPVAVQALQHQITLPAAPVPMTHNNHR